MATKLENIFLGSKKIFVNLPRFNRNSPSQESKEVKRKGHEVNNKGCSTAKPNTRVSLDGNGIDERRFDGTDGFRGESLYSSVLKDKHFILNHSIQEDVLKNHVKSEAQFRTHISFSMLAKERRRFNNPFIGFVYNPCNS